MIVKIQLANRQEATGLVAIPVSLQETGGSRKEGPAFTALNRFVALKMLETRNRVQERVSKGDESSGFKEFAILAPGLVTVKGEGYRLYIETLFDDIGQEVKVLFDRRDTASLLLPD